MSDHDDLVARRYRELRREVPSAALDKKVLAGARSAVTPRSFARRWAAPLAAAAVLVLAVGVTMQVQREEARRSPAREDAPSARAKTSAQPAPLEAKSPAPDGAAAASPAPAASATEAREIPFSPRRPLEPAPAVGAPASAAATVPSATSTAVLGAPAALPGAVPGAPKINAPPFGDIARAQRETNQAVAGFGILSGGSPAADSSGAGAAAGPFTIDQATTTGMQMRLVQPR